jgi:hypothetical protein
LDALTAVKQLDVFGDLGSGLLAGSEAVLMDKFGFRVRREKTTLVGFGAVITWLTPSLQV